MVPEGWQKSSLGDCATFVSGGTPSKQRPDYWGGDLPWVSAKDLKTHRISDAQDHLTATGSAAAKLADPNNILVLVRGMTLLKDVPIGIVTKRLAFNQDIKALVVRPNVHPLFLSYLLVGKKLELMGLVNTANHGTGRLDTALLKTLPINIPPLPEQKKIAEILSTWDKAIETTEKLLANAEAQKKALMQQLLTGKRQLKGFEEEWQQTNLGQIAEVNWGNTSLTKASYVESGASAYSASGRDGFVADAEHFGPGIVLSAIGARCGRCFLARDEWTAIKNTITIIAVEGKSNTDFLYFILNDPNVWPISGGAQPFIGLKNARSLKIRVPPIEEQKELAAVFGCCADACSSYSKQLSLLKTEKQALMQQLLTGKRRVTV
ncbi:MAG: restriction endonuclease subunit S [Roseibium sp.]|uniref:restriction endonuclease subunit S n=1 Tax=Roseibium sp. TaxID=1936156 RepID=UPI002608F991|nr:restriction endonuclease subunit S [Roseibium sp.]MCV0429608.1 restriction endonuclease subunit S [Roseibium sp.]